jgi:hypothetical protein
MKTKYSSRNNLIILFIFPNNHKLLSYRDTSRITDNFITSRHKTRVHVFSETLASNIIIGFWCSNINILTFDPHVYVHVVYGE